MDESLARPPTASCPPFEEGIMLIHNVLLAQPELIKARVRDWET